MKNFLRNLLIGLVVFVLMEKSGYRRYHSVAGKTWPELKHEIPGLILMSVIFAAILSITNALRKKP